MSIQYRKLFVFLILALAVVPGFSQDANTKKADTKTPIVEPKEEPRADGLRKITTRTAHDWDFDIHIDHEALEANIELAVEKAMKDVEIALENLERLEIHINPIEINLADLDLDIDPIEINIPDLDIDIDPIYIDLDDLDIDIDMDHDFDYNFDWDNNINHDEDRDDDTFLNKDKNKEKENDKEKMKNKSKIKDKSNTETTDPKEMDKEKGLKKVN